jgi:flavin-binding protein dodecin
MSEVYKIIELVGTSEESYTKALESAIRRAEQTLKGLAFYEVVEHRGPIRSPGQPLVHQVKVRIGFRVEDVHG